MSGTAILVWSTFKEGAERGRWMGLGSIEEQGADKGEATDYAECEMVLSSNVLYKMTR